MSVRRRTPKLGVSLQDEIRSCADDFEDSFRYLIMAIEPTAMYSSIFGEAIHLKLADAAHMKHIFERSPA
jgi:hypothetical protein